MLGYTSLPTTSIDLVMVSNNRYRENNVSPTQLHHGSSIEQELNDKSQAFDVPYNLIVGRFFLEVLVIKIDGDEVMSIVNWVVPAPRFGSRITVRVGGVSLVTVWYLTDLR